MSAGTKLSQRPEDHPPAKLAICGDWHANADWARAIIANLAFRGVDTIVHVGDFGFTFTDEFLTTVDDALAQAGMRIWLVDGNHDDHDYLRNAHRDYQGQPAPISDRVWHLPRGYRWNWAGISFLALGGAYSIDRDYRQLGVDWWEGEEISSAEARRAIDGGHADVMITHDCPAGVTIPGIEAPDAPVNGPHRPTALRAARGHRQLLRAVVDEVKPYLLFCGHYHRRYVEPVYAGEYEFVACILNRDGSPYVEHVAEMPIKELRGMVDQMHRIRTSR